MRICIDEKGELSALKDDLVRQNLSEPEIHEEMEKHTALTVTHAEVLSLLREMKQKEKESIRFFAQRLATFARMGNVSMEDSIVKFAFFKGLRRKRIRIEIADSLQLDWATVLQKAERMERKILSAQTTTASTPTAPTQYIRLSDSEMERLASKVVLQLRGTKEQSSSCRGRSRSIKGRCFNCRKLGHMARDCTSKPSTSGGNSPPSNSKRKREETPNKERIPPTGRDNKRRRADEGRMRRGGQEKE